MAFVTTKDGTNIFYKDLPRGRHSTHPYLINPDLLAFFRGETAAQALSEGAPFHAAEPVTAE